MRFRTEIFLSLLLFHANAQKNNKNVRNELNEGKKLTSGAQTNNNRSLKNFFPLFWYNLHCDELRVGLISLKTSTFVIKT